jgi:hypothetical protein
MKRTALLRKSPLRRSKPPRSRGKRAKKEESELQHFRRVVLERARGRCQRCDMATRLHPHHMKVNPRVHDPEWGRALCWWCHIIGVHGHEAPDWQDFFYRAGAQAKNTARR